MDIEIIDIEIDQAVTVNQSGTKGYKGHFRCSIVSGAAIFVPYTGAEMNLKLGNVISVETGQNSISDFKLLQGSQKPQISPLSVPGDYGIIGDVVLNTGDELFDIDVDDFSFVLDNDETMGIIPEVGQCVSFKLHGLSLWDENIIR